MRTVPKLSFHVALFGVRHKVQQQPTATRFLVPTILLLTYVQYFPVMNIPPPPLPPPPPPPPGQGVIRPLCLPTDKDVLSPSMCCLRQQIQVFSATADDVQNRQRNHEIVKGTVGLRCVHCLHLPYKDRARGAVMYPSSVRAVYQAARNFQRYENHMYFVQCTNAHIMLKSLNLYIFVTSSYLYLPDCTLQRYHVPNCPLMPDTIKRGILPTPNQRFGSRGGGRGKADYWANSCYQMGLMDAATPHGPAIFFRTHGGQVVTPGPPMPPLSEKDAEQRRRHEKEVCKRSDDVDREVAAMLLGIHSSTGVSVSKKRKSTEAGTEAETAKEEADNRGKDSVVAEDPTAKTADNDTGTTAETTVEAIAKKVKPNESQ